MPTINDLGIPGIGTGMYAAKYKNAWRLSFIRAGVALSVNGNDISLNIQSVSRPRIQNSKRTMHKYNSVAHDAGGKTTIDSVTFTVIDDVGGLAGTALYGIYNSMHRINSVDVDVQFLGRAATGSEYKFTAIFELLDGRGADAKVLETRTYGGCFFEHIDPGEMDYTDETGFPTFNVSMSVDTETVVYSGIEGSMLG